MGKNSADVDELVAGLEGSAPDADGNQHPLLVDLREKDALFDELGARYAAKVQ